MELVEQQAISLLSRCTEREEAMRSFVADLLKADLFRVQKHKEPSAWKSFQVFCLRRNG